MPAFHIWTLGCQMNVADSLKLAAGLERLGWTEAPEDANADLVVINKADLDANAAMRAEAQITSALRLLGQHGNPDHAHHDDTLWHPKVVKISALLGQGVDAFWAACSVFVSTIGPAMTPLSKSVRSRASITVTSAPKAL